MWLQELPFTCRELLFGVTIHFIPLREKCIKEKVNGKEKKIKDSEFTLNL